MIQDSIYSLTSRAGDGDDDDDHGEPHQGQAAAPDKPGMVFDS